MMGKENPKHLTSRGRAEAEGPKGEDRRGQGGITDRRVSLTSGKLGPTGQELGCRKPLPALGTADA